MVWPALIAAGAQLASSAWAGHQNREEAQRNRDFQSRMSSSAYSRAAFDLKSAGLNRVLALGNPASTPGGSTGNTESPNMGVAGTAAASAKQQISQSKAEEALIGQKQLESQSSEDLNRTLALTQGTQQALNSASALQVAQQTKLLEEQTRKTRLDSDRSEKFNPIYKGVNDILEWIDNSMRNSAAPNSPLKDFFDRANKELESGEAVKNIYRKFTEKSAPNTTIQRQSWPKFQRGGKR